MKQSIPEEDREEKRKREVYEKHKCKGCIWSTLFCVCSLDV
ncbi:hypothetical protein P8864_10425 [Priestia flexa]|nr:hypothetical protein [Priestia flexa]MEC0666304.1 hypothetical protein [Priestia flexa]